MTKLIVVLSILMGIISCQKKAIPVITERKEERRRDAGKDPSTGITILPDTIAGKAVFMASCGRCHDLPLPDHYTANRWEGILSTMMNRARLNSGQKVHITAWLKANAAK